MNKRYFIITKHFEWIHNDKTYIFHSGDDQLITMENNEVLIDNDEFDDFGKDTIKQYLKYGVIKELTIKENKISDIKLEDGFLTIEEQRKQGIIK